jgi:hypothetical protein
VLLAYVVPFSEVANTPRIASTVGTVAEPRPLFAAAPIRAGR